MKYQYHINYFLILSFALLMYSCKATKATSQSTSSTEETTEIVDKEKSRIDRFVPVEAVSDLKAGMSIEEVSSKLGSKPFNLVSGQADGHYIVQYKYRLSKFEVPTENINNNGIEKKTNKLFYDQAYQDLYVVFNGNGKLEYLVTTEGAMSEKLLRENNLLYVIKKDKDKFSTDTDKSYRETNSDAFSPLVACPDCEKKSPKKTETKAPSSQSNKSASSEEEGNNASESAPFKMTPDTYVKLIFNEWDKNPDLWKVYNKDGLYKSVTNIAQENYKKTGDASLSQKQLETVLNSNKKKGGGLKALMGL